MSSANKGKNSQLPTESEWDKALNTVYAKVNKEILSRKPSYLSWLRHSFGDRATRRTERYEVDASYVPGSRILSVDCKVHWAEQLMPDSSDFNRELLASTLVAPIDTIVERE